MGDGVFTFGALSRASRQQWFFAAFIAVLALLYLPMFVWKTVWLGQGADAQVFFRAAWAIWTGYPIYEVTNQGGWTYHYPPTFALFMGLFADPLPGHPRPWWALPYPAALVVWYFLNVFFMILSFHLWASALERVQPVKARPGFLYGPLLLRLGPALALLPFIGDGLARGQPAPLLLLLIVAFLILYIDGRVKSGAFFFALAIAIKVFPIVLGVLPLLRRDWKFLFWTAGWCAALLIGLPALCVGPAATLDLYRAMWAEHLGGLISGSLPTRIIGEVDPGGYDALSIGAALARIIAGQPFKSALPAWASAIQYLFNVCVIGAVALLGRGGFWNWRGAQPAKGYPLLAAGAVLLAATLLMVPVAKLNYGTFAVPLIGVLIIETWRRVGEQVVTARMIAWPVVAWLAFVSPETHWNWTRVIGPSTWAFLLLGPASLSLVSRVSKTSVAAGSRLG